MTKVAFIQQASFLLDREKTIEKATQLIAQAVSAGAGLVVFPEVYCRLPGLDLAPASW